MSKTRSNPPLSPWGKFAQDFLYDHQSVDWHDLVEMISDHVPPGVAIRRYRRMYQWDVKKFQRPNPYGMADKTETQIRSGSRGMATRTIWSMKRTGSITVTGLGSKKVVEMTPLGRERLEYRRKFEK